MNPRDYYLNILAWGLLAALGVPSASGQESARDWASIVGQRFRAERDVVYRTAPDGMELKLDFYMPYDKKPGPTMVYIHGGGWANGSKEQYVLWYLPYLQLGFRVVAVQYRLSGVAAAPAGVEDCRCAFRWIARNGAKYGVDPDQLILTGGSAGGHLVLLTAMLDDSFDAACGGTGPAPRARAVVNYYGPADLEEMFVAGQPSVLKWLRGPGDQRALARKLSPLRWVRPGVPPVLTLHGEADKTVPVSHGIRLHEALTKAGVENRLVTIPGGAHGRHTWTDADTIRVQRTIEEFLGKHAAAGRPSK
ncbi:MAG: alpha/beta hydrolase [Bryobacterales bacterium]|nr:alpha/beta hydrolase [Bryobacterales bacterium]